MKRLGHAYTLTEVLVVLAIIGALVSLSVAAFFQVREKSRASVCLNNMRQIALALRVYSDDNDGRFPTARVWQHWPGERCPDAPPTKNPYPDSPIMNSGYAMNPRLAANITGAFHRDDRVPVPATTVLLSEQPVGHFFAAFADLCDLQSCEKSVERASRRHSGGANYAFADGHVKWYLPLAVGTEPTNGLAPTFSVEQ